VRSGKSVKDFLTLLRNAILLRLAYEGGFKIRTFVSEDGRHIYAVLFLSHKNAEIIAE